MVRRVRSANIACSARITLICRRTWLTRGFAIIVGNDAGSADTADVISSLTLVMNPASSVKPAARSSAAIAADVAASMPSIRVKRSSYSGDGECSA